jgi:hypothetical protein
MLPNGDHLK